MLSQRRVALKHALKTETLHIVMAGLQNNLLLNVELFANLPLYAFHDSANMQLCQLEFVLVRS